MIEIWENHFGNTIELDVSLERDSYIALSSTMMLWGYRKVGVE